MRPNWVGVQIAGDGYALETVAGNLYPAGPGGAMLSWNNFDFGGCDGVPEPLQDGRALMICGDGPAVYTETTLVAQIPANVYVTADGERQKACSGVHRFTFTRVTP
jgi:hypothetical protein